jgi:alkaline phosphatase
MKTRIQWVRAGRRGLLQGFAAAALALVLAACTATGPGATSAGQSPRNIIIMFADGVAPTQWDFGRYSSRVLRNQPFITTDVVFREGALGLLTTSPLGPYVTDSAAAASAMSTGVKVENGAVSVTPDGKPLRTAMQAAKAAQAHRPGDDGDDHDATRWCSASTPGRAATRRRWWISTLWSA